MKSRFVAIFLGVMLVAGVMYATNFGLSFAVTRDNAWSFYRAFPRLTKEPLHVAPLTATLCTIPTAEMYEKEKLMTGPHYQARVHLYANPLAKKAIEDKTDLFPVSSVIVKEKLDDKEVMTAVGGMIKRDPGFDKLNGDWEYFYYAKAGEFSAGKIQSCITCHQAAAKTDYVYSVWALPK